MGSKICKRCKAIKDYSEFYKNAQVKDGYNNICRDCKSRLTPEQKAEKQRKLDLFAQGLKECTKCKKTQPLSEFRLSTQNKDGHMYVCKTCTRIDETTGEKGERRREQRRKQAKSPRGVARTIRYRETSPVYKAYREKYNKSEKVKQKGREYDKTLTRRLRAKASLKIYSALKAQSQKKQLEFNEYLGCTIEFFKEYISSMFVEGMTWDNWGRGKGKWHLDHIIPCANFDLSDIEQQKICFHYSNQQPLWEHDNLSKSSKYNGVRLYHKKTV